MGRFIWRSELLSEQHLKGQTYEVLDVRQSLVSGRVAG
jgi:hypothetical protein